MAARDGRLFRMGELTALSGVDKPSVHYYLRRGYLHPPAYKKGNQALYDSSHLDKLTFLRNSRDKGLPLPYACELWERRAKAKGMPRGRVRRAAGDAATRQEIVDAATRSFLQRGYRNTTISEIMEGVGTSKATFYYYFENKKDLYFDCLDNIFRTIFPDALDGIKKEDDPLRRLEMRWSATLSYFPEMVTFLQLIRESLRDEDEEHRRKAAEILRGSLIEPLKGDLEKGISRGEFRPVRIDVIVYALISILETISYRSMIGDGYDDRDIEQALLDFMLHGLRAEEG